MYMIRINKMRVLSLILCLGLLLGIMPSTAVAEEKGTPNIEININFAEIDGKITSDTVIKAFLSNAVFSSSAPTLDLTAIISDGTSSVTANTSATTNGLVTFSFSTSELNKLNYGNLNMKITSPGNALNNAMDITKSNTCIAVDVNQLEVGQIIPSKLFISFHNLKADTGYEYCVVYDDTDNLFKNYLVYNSAPSTPWLYHNMDTIVIDTKTFPAESGGWQGDETIRVWDPITSSYITEPLKGKSTYMMLTVPYIPYSVTHSLENVTATANTAGEKCAANRLTYKTTLTAAEGYALPDEITVKISDNTIALGTDYTYDKKTGEVTVIGDKINGNISITAIAHSHTFGAWAKEDDTNHIRTCDCGEVQRSAHIWDKGKVTTEPTLTSEGVKTYTCTACGGTKTESLSKLAAPPKIIAGNNQAVEEGKGATFKSDANIKDFVKLLVDDKEVSSDNYTLEEGSTIVNLKPEFVKLLSKGTHTISIVSTTGIASTEFTVTAAIDSTNPQTGDNSSMVLWIILFLVSGGLLIFLKTTLNRKKEASN